MPESKAEFYLHFVWTTQQRCPLLTPEVEGSIYRCIQAEARRWQCVVLALGGMPDHVHLAVKAPTILSPAQLMKQIKGVSSKFAADEFVRALDHPLDWFRWQEGYGAFSFSRSEMARVIQYIQNQKAIMLRGSFGIPAKPTTELLPSAGWSAKPLRRVFQCPVLYQGQIYAA